MSNSERRHSIRTWRGHAWLAFVASCAAYLVISLAHHQAFHPWGRLGFFDLRVYRGAGQLVLGGKPLYHGPIVAWAPFTYPTFAALVFAPLALMPLAIDEVLVTVLGVVALFAIVALALRLPMGGGDEAGATQRWRPVLIPVAVAAALWLEPITTTLGYGQINLLVALLIVGDLCRRDAVRSKGVLIGLAAGLKLTPMIFVPYLLFSGRRRSAMVALGTFATTVALGFAALPGDAQRFWGGGLFLDPRRVGGCCAPANQSLRGAILGLDPSFGTGRLIGVAVVVAIVGVLLAVLASRRGDEAMGYSLGALTGLLVSPVSWTHHWTLVVPALLLLGVRVVQRRSTIQITGSVAILLLGYAYLPKLMAKPGFAPSHGLWWTFASAPYVLIGLLALALAGGHEIRRAAGALPTRAPT